MAKMGKMRSEVAKFAISTSVVFFIRLLFLKTRRINPLPTRATSRIIALAITSAVRPSSVSGILEHLVTLKLNELLSLFMLSEDVIMAITIRINAFLLATQANVYASLCFPSMPANQFPEHQAIDG